MSPSLPILWLICCRLCQFPAKRDFHSSAYSPCSPSSSRPATNIKIFAELESSPFTHAGYTDLADAVPSGLKAMDGKQPGDIIMEVQSMIESVWGVRIAAGRLGPKRLPIGADGVAYARRKCM